MQGLLLFRNDYEFFDQGVFTVGAMYVRAGKDCLSVVTRDASGFPELAVAPCSRGVDVRVLGGGWMCDGGCGCG